MKIWLVEKILIAENTNWPEQNFDALKTGVFFSLRYLCNYTVNQIT